MSDEFDGEISRNSRRTERALWTKPIPVGGALKDPRLGAIAVTKRSTADDMNCIQCVEVVIGTNNLDEQTAEALKQANRNDKEITYDRGKLLAKGIVVIPLATHIGGIREEELKPRLKAYGIDSAIIDRIIEKAKTVQLDGHTAYR